MKVIWYKVDKINCIKIRVLCDISGIPYNEALKHIWMKDSRGLIVKDRPEGGITTHKAPFAHPHEPMKELNEIVKDIKPTCLIGAAAIGGVFTEEILRVR